MKKVFKVLFWVFCIPAAIGGAMLVLGALSFGGGWLLVELIPETPDNPNLWIGLPLFWGLMGMVYGGMLWFASIPALVFWRLKK